MFEKTIMDLIPSISQQRLIDIDQEIIGLMSNNAFCFGNVKTKLLTQRNRMVKNGKSVISLKRRRIYYYDKDSKEYIYLKFVKKEIDKALSIKYPNRSEIMKRLFNDLYLLKNLNDFVLVKVDLKDFFNSINSSFVFERYIRESKISRIYKNTIEDYSNKHKYCYAGLNLSNSYAELACRKFDKTLTSKLKNRGMIFYERYVDDMFFIFNRFIEKDNLVDEINNIIINSFENSRVKINMDKFTYISRRNDLSTKSKDIDFLGYNFKISETNRKLKIEYGITESKLRKYNNRLQRILMDYKVNGNIELLRQRLKYYCARVVMTDSSDPDGGFIVVGLIANYSELRNVINDIDKRTRCFLESSILNSMKKNNIAKPYFVEQRIDVDSMYSLLSNLRRNRAIIFDQSIGLKYEKIVSMIRRLGGNVPITCTYDEVVKYYISLIKM